MIMTFNEYIQNPMGRKNAVLSNREMYATLYKDKLDKILLRESGHIDFTLYRSGSDYIVHIKVPSEIVPDFYYDTVLWFYPPESTTVELDKTISNYGVKFYSNDPSFVYTFAHAFLENDLFIRDLLPRMSKQAVTKAAVVKNPTNQVGYVKSIYFSYLIMKRNGLFNKTKFDLEAKKFTKKELLNNVIHADIKVRDRQEQGQVISRENSAKRKKEDIKKKERTQSNNVIKSVKPAKNIRQTEKTKSIGRVNTIKKSKKI